MSSQPSPKKKDSGFRMPPIPTAMPKFEDLSVCSQESNSDKPKNGSTFRMPPTTVDIAAQKAKLEAEKETRKKESGFKDPSSILGASSVDIDALKAEQAEKKRAESGFKRPKAIEKPLSKLDSIIDAKEKAEKGSEKESEKPKAEVPAFKMPMLGGLSAVRNGASRKKTPQPESESEDGKSHLFSRVEHKLPLLDLVVTSEKPTKKPESKSKTEKRKFEMDVDPADCTNAIPTSSFILTAPSHGQTLPQLPRPHPLRLGRLHPQSQKAKVAQKARQRHQMPRLFQLPHHQDEGPPQNLRHQPRYPPAH